MKIFWAWQYDLPGKISRHFIREALEEAITRINQTHEIEEPDEAFQTGALQLDYGRKGLKGSPDLALAILKKIDDAVVFVGDVTPVGKGPPYTTDDGKQLDGKPLMNPNVALELGYALRAISTESILMVMNNHYGRREDMPFDLAHKGGPIFYKLAPNASKKEIEAEKNKLVTVLVEALGEYVPKPLAEPFPELRPQIGQGIFFRQGEALGEDKNGPYKFTYVIPFRQIMWLRVMPSRAPSMPLAVRTLSGSIAGFGAFGGSGGTGRIRQNAYGVAFFSRVNDTNSIGSISQYTRDGEIWGINADLIRLSRRDDVMWLSSLQTENLFITSLGIYVEFMQQVSKVPLPLQVEAGVEGIKGARFVHNAVVIGDTGIMHRDSVVHRGILKDYAGADQHAFLMQFFRKLHANTGMERPPGLYHRD